MYLLMMLISLLNFTYQGNLQIKDAWVRPAAEGMNTALYFNVENNSQKPDTLLAVKSSIAEIVQTHETYKKGDMMGMRKVDNIPIAPKSTFKFKPGGYHVMVIKLKKTLKRNDIVEFILRFKDAGDINIKATVK